MTFDDLVAALRRIDGLWDKGKVHPNFHYRSRPFLHFHADDGVTHADVRFEDDFEAVPANTATERRALLRRVQRHVAGT